MPHTKMSRNSHIIKAFDTNFDVVSNPYSEERHAGKFPVGECIRIDDHDARRHLAYSPDTRELWIVDETGLLQCEEVKTIRTEENSTCVLVPSGKNKKHGLPLRGAIVDRALFDYVVEYQVLIRAQHYKHPNTDEYFILQIIRDDLVYIGSIKRDVVFSKGKRPKEVGNSTKYLPAFYFPEHNSIRVYHRLDKDKYEHLEYDILLGNHPSTNARIDWLPGAWKGIYVDEIGRLMIIGTIPNVFRPKTHLPIADEDRSNQMAIYDCEFSGGVVRPDLTKKETIIDGFTSTEDVMKSVSGPHVLWLKGKEESEPKLGYFMGDTEELPGINLLVRSESIYNVQTGKMSLRPQVYDGKKKVQYDDVVDYYMYGRYMVCNAKLSGVKRSCWFQYNPIQPWVSVKELLGPQYAKKNHDDVVTFRTSGTHTAEFRGLTKSTIVNEIEFGRYRRTAGVVTVPKFVFEDSRVSEIAGNLKSVFGADHSNFYKDIDARYIDAFYHMIEYGTIPKSTDPLYMMGVIILAQEAGLEGIVHYCMANIDLSDVFWRDRANMEILLLEYFESGGESWKKYPTFMKDVIRLRFLKRVGNDVGLQAEAHEPVKETDNALTKAAKWYARQYPE